MTIGIVAEGPRDHDVIEAIADMLYPGSSFRPLQPEPVAVEGGTYGGYKGVWQWCIKSKSLVEELCKIPSHNIDMFIIQLDGDTTREKAVHCIDASSCSKGTPLSAAYCRKSYSECPLEIDRTFLLKTIEEKLVFLHEKIVSWLTADIHEKVVFCLPFDSHESWIVAAFDGERHGNPELIEKPADNVIARSSQYHGIRVKRRDGKLKKTEILYSRFLIPKLCDNWGYVKTLCKSAESFECSLGTKLGSKSAVYRATQNSIF